MMGTLRGFVAVVALAMAGVLLLAPPALSAPDAWMATGSLNTAREDQTATVLPNGKVLVAGGSEFNGPALASAEVFDRATGNWSATASMNTTHTSHTATLLPNGKVLIAGGAPAGGGPTAELYDPATGSWSATGPMITSRHFSTATLLPTGRCWSPAATPTTTRLRSRRRSCTTPRRGPGARPRR